MRRHDDTLPIHRSDRGVTASICATYLSPESVQNRRCSSASRMEEPKRKRKCRMGRMVEWLNFLEVKAESRLLGSSTGPYQGTYRQSYGLLEAILNHHTLKRFANTLNWQRQHCRMERTSIHYSPPRHTTPHGAAQAPFGIRYRPAAESSSPSIPPQETPAPALPLRDGPSDLSESLRIFGPFPPVHLRTSHRRITHMQSIRKG